MYGSIEQSGPLCSRGVQLSSHIWGQVQSTLNSRGDLEPWDLMARVSVDWYYSFKPWLQTIAHTGCIQMAVSFGSATPNWKASLSDCLTLCKAGSVLLLSLVSHLWTYRSIFIYYFIFGCAGLSLLCGLSLVTGGLISSCGVWASHCGGFSCCGTRAVGIQAPGVAAFGLSSSGYPALEHRFNCCGTWAWFLWGIQDLPGPGIELMSPGLAGGFFPTESPGEPRTKPLYTLPHVSTGKNFDALKITGPLDPPQWLLSRCQWYQQGCIQSPGWFLEEIHKHQAPEF